MSSEALLTLAQAAKSYPVARRPIQQLWAQLRGTGAREGERYALHPVSLELRKGESVGIVGLNGAGKSTLLQMAAGVLTPSSGSIQIRGRVAQCVPYGHFLGGRWSRPVMTKAGGFGTDTTLLNVVNFIEEKLSV